MIFRIFVEKRPGFDVPAQQLLQDLRAALKLPRLTNVRILQRYDVYGVTEDEFARAAQSVLSEPNCDVIYEDMPPLDHPVAVAYLPGQYDQRADSAAQCIQLITAGERPQVMSAVVYAFSDVSNDDLNRIRKYLINPVDSSEVSLDPLDHMNSNAAAPDVTPILDGFIAASTGRIIEVINELDLAMSVADLTFCQAYFRDAEQRDPTLTEIKCIDTYWSDHCRHTTFLTAIDSVTFDAQSLTAPIARAYADYLSLRDELNAENKDISLMDIAIIGMKALRKRGLLEDLDISDEHNACSIIVPIEVDGKTQEYLIMFKNETHNHPTEIEPFGGAATCLGGAIRDPLSGRSYVYQAMRVTGAGDPRQTIEDTLPGKLPQRKLTTTAAQGFSSYGNQIGLATGVVKEIYHPGYVAKRLETGAVISAAPREHVRREIPAAGDVIVLIGGATGRDGCGGATGSSKAHDMDSIHTLGAQVQKGNPPIERSLQRLFRNPDFTTKVKRANDFGAGGVCVAVGELSDGGITIDLSAIPLKYDGLTGTELAISESQERMACVIDARDLGAVVALSEQENLLATRIATVTESPRLIMSFNGRTIVNIARSFLDTNGVTQRARANISAPNAKNTYFTSHKSRLDDCHTLPEAFLRNLQDLNICSQKGLIERFDSTIGAGSVLTPFGGASRLTQTEAMAAKIPTDGESHAATIMSCGYNPYLSSWSPFHGAVYAVVESLAKVAAAGGDITKSRLTFQEFFPRLGAYPEKWGMPLSAMLGALDAQLNLGVAAIGGKDSMSGTFEDISVPPTLISFAICPSDARGVITPELKQAGHMLALLPLPRDNAHMPDYAVFMENCRVLFSAIRAGGVISAHTVGEGGVAAAIAKMAFGNGVGVSVSDGFTSDIFAPDIGGILVELTPGTVLDGAHVIGKTIAQPEIRLRGRIILIEDAAAAWCAPLEGVFPTSATATDVFSDTPYIPYAAKNAKRPAIHVSKPRVFIPVFQGTNCEYDTARAFEKFGGVCREVMLRNLTPDMITDSVHSMAQAIDNAQIIAFPGGFSAGDEPEGSGKFIATAFRHPLLREAVAKLLARDGLILGICNGFQALIKLGLLPYGEILDRMPKDAPTLTFNAIARHVSQITQTVVSSALSPFMMYENVGDVHAMPVSHGEGRFVATLEQCTLLQKAGCIATQYVDNNGHVAKDTPFNPNGSAFGIEGIFSPDGRIFGKMGHSERNIDANILKNIKGARDEGIFRAGIDYFRL